MIMSELPFWTRPLTVLIDTDDGDALSWCRLSLGPKWHVITSSTGMRDVDVVAIDIRRPVSAMLAVLSDRSPAGRGIPLALLVPPTGAGDEGQALVAPDAWRIGAEDAVRLYSESDLDRAFRYLVFRQLGARAEDRHLFDPQTHLARENLLEDVVDLALARAARVSARIALMALAYEWIDLDGNPVPTDPRQGLIAFSKRLQESRRATDFACRRQDGALYLMLESYETADDQVTALRSVMDRLSNPFLDFGPPERLALLKIGVGMADRGEVNAAALIRAATAGLEKTLLEWSQLRESGSS
jgi:hypothetical protein